jgi:ubiquinone/menaquinone biosynthesis C-methylase UbiE
MTSNIKIVKKFEGDSFFKRNIRDIDNENLNSRSSETIINFLNTKKYTFQNVLEVGCSGGYQLNKYFNSLNLKKNPYFLGIDLSSKAINFAKKKYKTLHFKQVSSLKIQNLNKKFDMIILGFFLFLLDREEIFNQFNEVVKSLKKDGILIINDFFPKISHYNLSKHSKKIKIYKMRYDKFLTESHLFKKLHLVSWKYKFKSKQKFFNNHIHVSVYKKIYFEKEFIKET